MLTKNEQSLSVIHPALHYCFEMRHPRCVSNKPNCKVYAYIVEHNYVLSGMLYTILKAQLHVSATNFGQSKVKPSTSHTCAISHLHFPPCTLYTPHKCMYIWLISFHCTTWRWPTFVTETC